MNTRGKFATTLYEFIERDGKIDNDNAELVIATVFKEFDVEENNWTGGILSELEVE